MSWLDFLRKAAPSASASPEKERLEIPLFPLGGVLCPGGVLSLKVFEQRYLDMAGLSMKEARPFGICLIASGDEAGGVAEPHAVGTLARIVDWEMAQLGILLVVVTWAVALTTQRLNLFSCVAKDKEVFRSHVFLHLHVCPVKRANG